MGAISRNLQRRAFFSAEIRSLGAVQVWSAGPFSNRDTTANRFRTLRFLSNRWISSRTVPSTLEDQRRTDPEGL